MRPNVKNAVMRLIEAMARLEIRETLTAEAASKTQNAPTAVSDRGEL
ncbi:hypothetical protein [Acidocella sp. KAb 2-4]|nr:hypothetical protein [Acidocella sp. KAb 2-4]MCB5946040.1 hypothetical protein [Acidocella sp. KAb 2-4]